MIHPYSICIVQLHEALQEIGLTSSQANNMIGSCIFGKTSDRPGLILINADQAYDALVNQKEFQDLNIPRIKFCGDWDDLYFEVC
jgi:hypothetical protein